MPIESIKTPRAPADWRPSRDQQRQIASDARLQRLGRDDLYLFFNKPKSTSPKTQPRPSSTPSTRNQSSGGLGGIFNRVSQAMRGGG